MNPKKSINRRWTQLETTNAYEQMTLIRVWSQMPPTLCISIVTHMADDNFSTKFPDFAGNKPAASESMGIEEVCLRHTPELLTSCSC
ncbi:MAG TPA: hypothetical protein VE641_13655 [Chthoniobacterales bacterium]|nr:hypothetical protein [Chthoniobacterales bacterium]